MAFVAMFCMVGGYVDIAMLILTKQRKNRKNIGKGMFEPIAVDRDELQLAVSLPELDTVDHAVCVPLEGIAKSEILNSSLDALFVSGLLPEQRRELATMCDIQGLELVVFEHPFNDKFVIKDVVLNITNKLFSNEMPKNIDFADIRNLNQSSDYLFAFNSQSSALEFLQLQELGAVIGGVYLAHGNVDLDEYQSANQQLSRYISEYGYLCSSFHSSGFAECTILLGIKR